MMKKLIALITAAVMALSMVACSGADSSQAASGTDQSEAQAQSTGGEVTKGGTLVISVLADASTMMSTDIRAPANLNFATPVYETLLSYDKNGDPKPFLAKSITEDVENLTYTI